MSEWSRVELAMNFEQRELQPNFSRVMLSPELSGMIAFSPFTVLQKNGKNLRLPPLLQHESGLCGITDTVHAGIAPLSIAFLRGSKTGLE